MKRTVRFALVLLVVVGGLTALGVAQDKISVGIDQSTRSTWGDVTSAFEQRTGYKVTLHAYPQSNVAQQVVFQSFSRSGQHHFFMIPTSWGASLYR